MPSKKFIWDPQHWRFRARTVADQMTHEEGADDHAAHCHGLRPSC
jgi:hypothetical protein